MEEIRKIYELLFSPIVTPYNLLENIKLQNYDYVKYYKGSEGIISELKCTMDNTINIFFYHFDENDKLTQIYMKNEDLLDKELVFDRNVELEIAKDQYYEQQKEASKVAV